MARHHRFYKGERRNNDECAKTGSISRLRDDRGDTRVCRRLDAGRASRSANCRRRRSHQRATAGCSGRGSTRARVRPGADRSAGARAARGRDSPAHPRGADAGQRRAEEVHRRRQVGGEAAAEEVRVADDAAAAATERRRDLHADRAAHGPAARRIRRDREGRATSICCCTAIRSPTGGCRATRTRRCSTSTSASIRTANFAIAGDTTQGVLWGLQNGEGQGFQPKAIMLMIGTNNTGANTAPEIAEGIGAVVLEMRHDFPDAKILLLAIFPARRAGRSGARQDRRGQPDHREAGRSAARVLHGHRREVPGREGRVPARHLPAGQPASRWRRATTSGARPFSAKLAELMK